MDDIEEVGDQLPMEDLYVTHVNQDGDTPKIVITIEDEGKDAVTRNGTTGALQKYKRKSKEILGSNYLKFTPGKTSRSPSISNISIRINDSISELKFNETEARTCCSKILKSFNESFNELKLNGREQVKRERSSSHSFKLKEDKNKVANYDDSLLEEYWNQNLSKPSFCKRVLKRLKHGVVRRALPTVSFYLFGHYLWALIIITKVCTPKIMENQETSIDASTEGLIKFLYNNYYSSEFTNITFFCENYAKMHEHWKGKEHSMTRVLTLLVGFYVGFVMRTWWQQLRMIPTIDALCMAIGSWIAVDSGTDEDTSRIEIDHRKVSIRQFKKDFVRYYLLSWTMCLSRISQPLKLGFPKPESFCEKRLLSKKEYSFLTTDTDDDCWLEKWTIPLIWANKMVNSVGKETKVQDLEGNAVPGVRFREPKEMAIANYKFKDMLHALNNQYLYRIPDLMLHCITYALYFFMFLGVFAGQGMAFSPNDDRTTFEKLLSDFPFYYVVKYGLLISWLKAASDLQNPFGNDDWDLKTPVLLDFEIWKASNMLFQHIPYGDKYAEIESDDEPLWDDSWHDVFGRAYEAKKMQKSDPNQNQNNGGCSFLQEKVPEVQITNDDVNADRKQSDNGKQA